MRQIPSLRLNSLRVRVAANKSGVVLKMSTEPSYRISWISPQGSGNHYEFGTLSIQSQYLRGGESVLVSIRFKSLTFSPPKLTQMIGPSSGMCFRLV